jgi:hydrogenase maturation protease
VPARILVAGIGNIFLGDDGFGCDVVGRLALDPPRGDVRIVDYGIRGMHLAYDLLDGYQTLILVDALPGDAVPGTVRVLEVTEDDLGPAGLDAHAMDPATVLASLRALGGQLPRTLVVGCIPADLEERIGLSEVVAAAVAPAIDTVRALLEDELARSAQSDRSDRSARSAPRTPIAAEG